MSQRLEKYLHLHGEAGRQFLALTHNVPPPQLLCLPIDVGKNLHWALLHDQLGHLLQPPFSFPNSQPGFTTLLQAVEPVLAATHAHVLLIGLEPTGIYHEALTYQLTHHFQPYLGDDQPLRVRLRQLNPALVKLNRQQRFLRLQSTDQMSLAAIGDLLARGLGHPLVPPSGPDLQVREEARFLRTLEKDHRRLLARLTGRLDPLWPGALLNRKKARQAHPDQEFQTLASRFWQRQFIQALLLHCPNPYQALRLGEQGLIDLFHQHDYRCGPKTAQKILAAFSQALLPPEDVAAVHASFVQQEFALFHALDQQRSATLLRLADLIPLTPARHLLPLRGASPQLMAAYWGRLLPVSRFLHADQIWAQAGLHPSLDVSGDRVVHGPLSKEGDPYLRHAIIQCSAALCYHHPFFGALYLDLREHRAKSHLEAVIHVGHRLNRIGFHLLLQDQPFDPPGGLPTEADEEAFRQRRDRFFAHHKTAPSSPRPRRPRKRTHSRRR